MILGVLVALGACGTSAIGVSVCDQIEDARCTRLGTIGHLCTDPDSSTPIDFLAPFADATDPTPENIAACIRFYSTACLHGLVSPDLPSTGQVNDCLAAINDGSCAVVVDPVTADACLWLAEGGPEAEAATEDADAKDDDDTTKFSVGGTVTGLASADSVTLQDNGGNTLTLTANGSFAFTTDLTSGSSYLVTVLTQPSSPAQVCAVTHATGTVTTADITNVVVTCVSNVTIGGTVTGLASKDSLTLQDNGADNLIVTANGSFVFSNALESGSSYLVTILAQPSSPKQVCAVTHATGTVTTADVTDVVVTCKAQ